jgi:hypothetical protein
MLQKTLPNKEEMGEKYFVEDRSIVNLICFTAALV